jgi:glycosyltransferase involved in cell wall biosynthesis
VLEAQWTGLPVVASDIVAHRDAMPPASGGVLFPLDDAPALAHELTTLAAAPARRRGMAASAQAFAHRHYDMRRYVDAFASLYGDLVATDRQRTFVPERSPTPTGLHAVLRTR